MITHQPTAARTLDTFRQDAMVAELATCELRRSSYLALRSVRCTYRDGVLTLRGRLYSFYLKQVAQSLVRDLASVRRVENEIEVDRQCRDASAPKNPQCSRVAS